MRRIVLPQAMRAIVPPAADMLIGTLTGTSIVSVIADLLHSVRLIYDRTYQVIPLLLVATVWYLIRTTRLTIVQYYVERYFSHGAQRFPTPWQQLRGRDRPMAPPMVQHVAEAPGGVRRLSNEDARGRALAALQRFGMAGRISNRAGYPAAGSGS